MWSETVWKVCTQSLSTRWKAIKHWIPNIVHLQPWKYILTLLWLKIESLPVVMWRQSICQQGCNGLPFPTTGITGDIIPVYDPPCPSTTHFHVSPKLRHILWFGIRKYEIHFLFPFFYYLPIKTLAFVVKTCQDGKVNNILSTYHGVFSLGSRHEYCDYSRRLSIKCYPSKHYNPRKMYKNHCLSLFLGACIEGRVGALVVNTWPKERVDIVGG